MLRRAATLRLVTGLGARRWRWLSRVVELVVVVVLAAAGGALWRADWCQTVVSVAGQWPSSLTNVRPEGLEPPTDRVETGCSIH